MVSTYGETRLSDERAESRADLRIEADFQVRYASIDQLLVAYCGDLSKGGMFIETDRFLPLNAVVRVHLELPDRGGSLPVICRVAFVRSVAAPESPAGMGLQFLDLSDDCLGILEGFIAARLESDAARPQSSAPAQRRLRILVVDDDPHYQRAAVTPFRARGDDVRVANDGFEGLSLCLKDPPDIILTDVQMPRMDGWQFLRMVRSRPSLASVPVVFTTTLSGDADRLRGYQLGVDDYLAKPYRAEELCARVDRVAQRAEQSPRQIERKTLRGDLTQVSLPSVLSFLELEQKSGVLFVVSERTGRLFMHQGRPLRVELDGATPRASPRELAFQLLGWSTGQFEFAVQDVALEDQLQSSVTTLLLEHARLHDEANNPSPGAAE